MPWADGVMVDSVEEVRNFGLWLTMNRSISSVGYRFEDPTHAECSPSAVYVVRLPATIVR